MKSCLYFIAVLILFTACRKEKPSVYPVSEWTNLLDTNLSQWEKFIGVPHYSVNVDGYPKGDGMNGTPLGLNNDPLNVYKVEIQDGVPVLHISGEIYGGLTTRQEYENYHLKLEFKWGDRKYEPRLNAKRDNGILYHAYGAHGAFWNVWMLSQEFQVQETDMGDYFALGPEADIHADYRTEDNELEWIYDPVAAIQSFGGTASAGRCRRAFNNEQPHGEWNTLELICVNDKSIHIVNGKVVMRLENGRVLQPGNIPVALTKGKIQIQSEGAEAYYRNMLLRPISEIPIDYK